MAMSKDDLDNRFSHHDPLDTSDLDMSHVRELIRDLAEDLNVMVPDGREKSLAMTNLEQVMFWANAGIARAGGK